MQPDDKEVDLPESQSIAFEPDPRAMRLIQFWRRPVDDGTTRPGANWPFKKLYAAAVEAIRVVEEPPGMEVTYTDQPSVQYRDPNVLVVPVTVQVPIDRAEFEKRYGARGADEIGATVRADSEKVVREHFIGIGVTAPIPIPPVLH